MLKNIVKIQYNSDFTLNCKLPNGYDNQDFIIRLYTTDKDDYYEASYLNGEYINCLADDDNKNVVVYVNNHGLQPGCLHVGLQIDYDNTHFQDNVENIITAEETNVYLVKQNANATSAMYVGSALPDLTGSSDFITQSDLEFELLNYYTKEDIDNASYISSADLNDFVTEEELNDMGFLSQSQLDAMGYTTKDYVDTKTSQKQDRLINGVNIKTVNGYSLLGNGNISISGISQDDLDNAIAPLVSQEALTETLSYYVSHAELNSASYVTESQLQQAGYATQSFVDDAIADAFEDSDFMTETDVNNLLSTASYLNQSDLESQLNQAGYVTSSQLSAMGYITMGDVSACGYITNQDLEQTLSNATYITQNELETQLADYVTSSELSNAGYVTESEISSMGYATESYVSDYVSQHAPTPDLSAYVTKTELSNAGYITTSDVSQMGYVTGSDLSNMGYITMGDVSACGYITSIPSEYVTESELSAKGYITSIPSEYVTQSALSNMGYLTAIPSEYVTESELSAKSYATTTQLATKQDTLVSGTNIKTVNNNSLLGSGNITISSSGNLIAEVTQAEYEAMQQAGTLDPNTIYVITDAPATDLSYYALKTELTENLIPNTTNTYTLGDSSHIYKSTYTSKLYLGSNITIAPESNAQTGSDITININGSQKFYLNSTRFAPNGASNDKAIDLGTSDRMWKTTYSYQYYENGTNISDKYATKSELNNASYVTQTQLNNAGYVTQTQLNNAGYLTSIPNTYATYAAISNMGYLTSANFIYDSSTYTLTISI